ncbi:acetyl/propionyl/methylcrotonyl-CoA carboxylase subunit alpha [Acinetobacter baumannii]|uniref:acetyl/propionyl/methylcrotonyl-CoA carboxylase subunit alpha n=1 Tax=Acinetobacter baumannii TaxID=470 RepID=UPI000B93D8D8|nr:biotin carboxylase N-terminal domain-containing protein [Acinetobacter baumannii]OYD33820.1 acetyl/propionyl-CoA carboxylase subunit alpha [Acinetobacter baumannii]
MNTEKLLIANRGEIAVRIIHACRDMGISSVALYADDDIGSMHVELADEAWGLAGATASETYLNIPAIIEVAKKSKATMVHPGYGFLSERAEFAQAVIDAGLKWVGPSPSAIEKLGDKIEARKIAASVGAPLVQGTQDPLNNADEALEFAKQYGLPIAIKAAFGGGGRGLKVAWKLEEVKELYESAVREAKAAFGRGECFVEQYLDKPRHVEAQVIADQHGNIVVLGTRDCSLQRRNQKLVEEAPAPFISDEIYQQILSSAKNICQAANYVGAGTVETSKVDLVVEQIRVAQGEVLSIKETPKAQGHAIEFRINAEDPARGFIPAFGVLSLFEAPFGNGVRVDTGIRTGSLVSSHFDSLMAKLIVTGPTREVAIARAKRALKQFKIEGVASVLDFHRAVLNEPDFTDEFNVHTRWIENDFKQELKPTKRGIPNHQQPMLLSYIEIDGKLHRLGLPAGMFAQGPATAAQAQTAEPEVSAEHLLAPINGVISAWKVENGEQVTEGQVVAIMEAMKMEVQVLAHRSGVIQIGAEKGTTCHAETAIASIH